MESSLALMTPYRMSRIEAIPRLIIAFNEALNKHDYPAMMKLLSNDCRFETAHPAPNGDTFSGKAQIIQYWKDFFQRSPHAFFKMEEVNTLGLRCIAPWTCNFQNDAEKESHIRGVNIFRVEHDLISDIRSYVKGEIGE